MLELVGENIWVVDGECVNFYGFAYSTRSVIIRLKNHDLWIWSPIALSDNLKLHIEKLGKPKHLVSPNKIHHLFLSQWSKAYPEAIVWGPQSTISKRQDLTFAEALTDHSPSDWQDEIDQVWFNGSPAMDEVVFFHKASRTVILADLSENFGEAFLKTHWSRWQQMLARFWGIVEGKGYAPLEWRLSFFNRRSTKKSRDRLLAWNPDKVIMAHGVWQRQNGRAYLEKSFSWIGR